MDRRFVLKSALAATALAALSACAGLGGGDDVVDVADANGNFTTLVAAIEASGLEETLRSGGPFTVFAPTDEAFAALPAGTVENLLKPENQGQLVSILTYHVLPAAVQSADVLGTRTDVATVNGETVRVDGRGDSVKVNDANVTTADIAASNGVIHVIDKVLMP